MKKFIQIFAWALVFLIAPSYARSMQDVAPFKVTDTSRQYRMSRSASRTMEFDSRGTLHLTYWSGGIAATPGTPSFIHYRSWTPDAGFSAEISIDDSEVMEGHIGGRHPSLAVDRNDTVHVVWHDNRHSMGPSWIDNSEIYLDRKPLGGAFSSTDIRLTNSMATHAGDNGLTPKIIAHRGGQLSASWFDFNLDPAISDVYLKISDAAGNFDLGETLPSLAVTNLNDRGQKPGFSVPDIAIDSAGNRHLVWAGGFGSKVDLYYAEVEAGSTTVVRQTMLADGGADFFDPPKVKVSPAGDVWIAYGDDEPAGGENVKLLRRRKGRTDFDPPILIDQLSSRQFAPDIAFDSEGRMHLVWVDERAATQIFYGLYDIASGELLDSRPITTEPKFWSRPTLALDPDEKIVAIVFEEILGISRGDIYFATVDAPKPLAGVPGKYWRRYR